MRKDNYVSFVLIFFIFFYFFLIYNIYLVHENGNLLKEFEMANKFQEKCSNLINNLKLESSFK